MHIARHPLSLVAVAAMLALGACANPPGDAAAQAQAAQAGNEVVAPAAEAEAVADADASATPCNADAAQSYIGQDASEATVAAAQAAAGATGALRVIKPGQPVTMDFRADRLNVEVDDGNAIVRITCG
jgi:hypothetical protein